MSVKHADSLGQARRQPSMPLAPCMTSGRPEKFPVADVISMHSLVGFPILHWQASEKGHDQMLGAGGVLTLQQQLAVILGGPRHRCVHSPSVASVKLPTSE